MRAGIATPDKTIGVGDGVSLIDLLERVVQPSWHGARLVSKLYQEVVRRAGGRRKARAVALFAAVLALDSADHATVGSSAVPLRNALHISMTQLGLLSTVSSVVGAFGTLAFGVVVDRIDRSRLLAVAVAVWAVAMVAGALSPSFVFLLATRVCLGAMTAAAGPAIASMTGDLFDPSSRARVYGLILAGELLGTGIGFAVTGSIAAWSWRASFFVLALPALVLSPLLWLMREPERATSSLGGEAGQDVEDTPDELDDRIVDAMRREGVRPRAKDVLHEDPTNMPLPRVVRYVLSIRTNLLLVIASVCGYYFFAGVSTFGITFIRDQYHVGQAQASSLTLVLGAGAIVGVLASGRLADALLERGRAAARVEVAVVALAVAVVLFVPALLADSLVVALPLLTGAALALGALNPPLDAARLDIMPPRLWGRAEGVRSMMRAGAQAAAPLAFGAMSSQLFSGGARGLQLTFLMMLVPLAGSVGIGWLARRTYLPDVAAASRSTAKLASGDEGSVRSRSGATRSSSRENASAG